MLYKIIIIYGLVLFGCNSQNKKDNYQSALSYISSDSDLIDMIKEYRPYGEFLLFRDGDLVYKVYPERENEIYDNFEGELSDFVSQTVIDSLSEVDFFRYNSFNETLEHYTISDTAKIKIFFTEPINNVLASEVFFMKRKIPDDFDTYRGNLISNVGMSYLFVFEEGRIDTVLKNITQYN